jgi:hypothetical protein
MATLDQLPAEQRAIVELVVQRGRSYATLADVLQVPSERVRELARDALTELSPRTAQRVENKWRGQIADYLLGQQSDADARLTREHLRQSETGRAWALSLLDSLDPLYPNGAVPPVPDPDLDEPEAEAPAEPEPEPEPEVPAEPERRPLPTLEDRVRERAQKQPVQVDPEVAEKAPDAKPEVEPEPARARPGELSPEAQSALRRRRILGAVGGLVVLAGIVLGILAIAGVFSSDDNGGSSSTASTPTETTSTTGTTTTGQPIQVLGQIALSPVGKTRAQGVAYVVQQGNQKFVVVQAQVPPLPNSQKVAAYEVWLYNSNSDARSLGAQYTDKQGILQGRAELPADYSKFKSIDVSRELFSDKNAGHGKASVLRGNFADLKPVPQQQQGGAGTTTTPGG